MTPSIGIRAILAAGTLIAALTVTSSRATAQTYKIDDGTPGYAISYGLPDDFCWMNHLTVQGTVTLTSIEAILGDGPEGMPVSLCIWRDLGGAGDPSQGLLLTRLLTHVRNSGDQLLTEYAIPPTQVTDSFFVGALLTTDGTFSPATLDPHTPTAGRSWFATGYGPGTFDPTFTGNWTWYSPPSIGMQGVFMLRANGTDGPTPEVRCLAKTNSQGCVPVLSFSGTSSASAGSGFTITATNVLNQKSGFFMYSRRGAQQTPYGGGSLCILQPIRRTPHFSSGGSSSGLDCSGSYAFDFNAWIASGADPAIVPGMTIDGQFWSRDPGFAPPLNMGVTGAAHFGIGP